MASSMLGSVLPAHASVLPSGTLAVAAGGSDTTEKFMGDYLSGKTSSNDGVNTYTVQTYNIPAFPTSPYTVDEDARCPAGIQGAPNYTGTIDWVQGAQDAQPPHAPSGSGAGRNTLISMRNVGTAQQGGQQVACLDIARSSSKGSETGLDYYGFALDTVSWATTSLKAPSNLTRDQVKRIFNCQITDWSQVGGAPGPIQRYLPQPSSGTFQVFLTDWLGQNKDGSQLVKGQGPSCPDPVQTDKNGNPFEENQATTVLNSDIDKMIMPYSAGVWTFQKNNSSNPTLDRRNGARIGTLTTNLLNATDNPSTQQIDNTKPVVVANPERWNGTNVKYELDYVNSANPNGVVADTNTTLISGSNYSSITGYTGVRFLFNVVDSTNLQSYGPAVGLVGFDNSTTGTPAFVSPLCNNGARTLILTYGFAPLPQVTSTFNKSTTAPTSCRKF